MIEALTAIPIMTATDNPIQNFVINYAGFSLVNSVRSPEDVVGVGLEQKNPNTKFSSELSPQSL